MIFVTVGAQMPFDRLVRVVDRWAAGRPAECVFAQIGATKWRPRHIEWVRFLSPREFMRHAKAARVIVAHAGMGSIITAIELDKPILVMPRLGQLGETRNDHQVATAQRFVRLGLIDVAMDEQEMAAKLDQLDRLHRPGEGRLPLCPYQTEDAACVLGGCAGYRPGFACPNLIEELRAFLGT